MRTVKPFNPSRKLTPLGSPSLWPALTSVAFSAPAAAAATAARRRRSRGQRNADPPNKKI